MQKAREDLWRKENYFGGVTVVDPVVVMAVVLNDDEVSEPEVSISRVRVRLRILY